MPVGEKSRKGADPYPYNKGNMGKFSGGGHCFTQGSCGHCKKKDRKERQYK